MSCKRERIRCVLCAWLVHNKLAQTVENEPLIAARNWAPDGKAQHDACHCVVGGALTGRGVAWEAK
eukprot:5201138-Amphidinium_carterae.1